MNPDELIHLLTSMRAAHEVAQAIADPDLQTARGWDLKRWRCDDTPDAVRFVHHNRHGQPDVALLCVPADDDAQWVYETARKLAPCSTTLLKLQK